MFKVYFICTNGKSVGEGALVVERLETAIMLFNHHHAMNDDYWYNPTKVTKITEYKKAYNFTDGEFVYTNLNDGYWITINTEENRTFKE